MTRNVSAEVMRSALGHYVGESKNKSLHLDGVNTPFDALAGFLTKGMIGHAGVVVLGDSTNDTQSRQRNLDDHTQTVQRWFYLWAKMMVARYPNVHTRYTRFDNIYNALQSETVGTKAFQEWFVLNTTAAGRGGIDAQSPAPGAPGVPGGAGRWVRHQLRPHQWFTDLDIAWEVKPVSWTPTTTLRLVQLSKTDDLTDLDLWATLNADKTVTLRWFQANGTQRTMAFPVPLAPATDTTQMSVRVQLDVDNGAGGCTGRLFTSPKDDDYHWTQVGGDVVSGAVTDIRMRAATSWYFAQSGNGAVNGRYYSCWAKSYINGPTYLPVSMVAWEPFQVNMLGGGPSLDIYEGAYPTKAIDDTFDNDQWAPWMLPDANTLLVVLSSSHNDDKARGLIRGRALEQWVSNIRYRCPHASIVAISQNPDVLGDVYATPATQLGNAQDHHFRVAQDAAFWRQLGVGYVDTFRAFLEDPRAITSITNSYHHPNDDGTGLANQFDLKTGVATNPVTRQAQIFMNAFTSSPFAAINAADLTRN